jgi:hypothetical protein
MARRGKERKENHRLDVCESLRCIAVPPASHSSRSILRRKIFSFLRTEVNMTIVVSFRPDKAFAVL